MNYVIGVVFNERGYWSKAYSYKSDTKYSIGDVVLVPMRDFYAVGKVVSFTPESEYLFKTGVDYKSIIKKVI
jgi:hypothetical protein